MSPEAIASVIELNGICVCPQFLSPAELHSAQFDFEKTKTEGKFHRAGVGQDNEFSVNDKIRRDEVFWLEREMSNSIQDLIWIKLDLLKAAFNASPYFLGLNEFEGHYASYAKEGFYKRHLDVLKKNNRRTISLIIYLNHQWQASDGGRLRIYDDFTKESRFTDVDPIGGSMVCFMSNEFEHEVCISHAERSSITGWFKTVS